MHASALRTGISLHSSFQTIYIDPQQIGRRWAARGSIRPTTRDFSVFLSLLFPSSTANRTTEVVEGKKPNRRSAQAKRCHRTYSPSWVIGWSNTLLTWHRMFLRRTFASLNPEIIDCRVGGWSIPQMIASPRHKSSQASVLCWCLQNLGRKCNMYDVLLSIKGHWRSQQVLWEDDLPWTTCYGSWVARKRPRRRA